MNRKLKLKQILALLALTLLWQTISYAVRYFQPMEVVDFIKSKNGHYDFIVLKNPPLNEQNFIQWWLENKESIKEKYDIPSIDSETGSFRIGVWDIAGGYETDKDGEDKPGFFPLLFGDIYEQTCILELPQENRCVEKENRYASIGRAVSGWYYIDFANSNEYIQNDRGEFTLYKSE